MNSDTDQRLRRADASIKSLEMALQRSVNQQQRISYLNALATELAKRFNVSNRLADIARAVHLLEEALTLQPQDTDRLALLRNLTIVLHSLSAALFESYRRTGAPAELSRSIEAGEQSIALLPPGTTSRSSTMANLATALWERYHSAGDIGDLTRAVQLWDASVATTPETALELPDLLNSLGAALLALFDQTRRTDDLMRAEKLLKRSVDLTPPTDVERPRRVRNLEAAQRERGESADGSPGLEDAGPLSGALGFFDWQARAHVSQTQSSSPDRWQRVFLSYRAEDRRLARALRIYLEGLGFIVDLYDPENLWPAASRTVDERIAASGALIVLENSSRHSEWLKAEIECARAHKVPVIQTLGSEDCWEQVPAEIKNMTRPGPRARLAAFFYEETFTLIFFLVLAVHSTVVLILSIGISRLFHVHPLTGVFLATLPLTIFTPLVIAHRIGEWAMIKVGRGRFIDVIAEQLNRASLLSRIFGGVDGASEAASRLENQAWENWDVMANPFRRQPKMPGDIIFHRGILLGLTSPIATFLLLLLYKLASGILWSLRR